MSPLNELQSACNDDEYEDDLEIDGHSVALDEVHPHRFQGKTTNGCVVMSPIEETNCTMPNDLNANHNTGAWDLGRVSWIDWGDLKTVISNIEEDLCEQRPHKRSRTYNEVPLMKKMKRVNSLQTQFQSVLDDKSSHMLTKVLIEMVIIIFDVHGENDLLFSADYEGDTKLHLAIIFLLEDVALAMINSVTDYSLLCVHNKLFQTPLTLAVTLDMPKVARRLMSCGVEIDTCDHNGNTPLHIACRDRNTKMVELLLTPIRHDEVINNKTEITYRKIPQDMSIRNFEGETCIEIAFKHKDMHLIDMLLQKGANVDQRCLKTGRTLLYRSCLSGDINIVKRLISEKCNINMRAYDGSTPFDAARASGHWQIAAILAERGAESDSDGE